MTAVERWCRVTVAARDGSIVACRALEGPGAPDLAAIDDLARLLLFGKRWGGRVTVTEISPAMSELIALAGLPVEVQGQAEGGEQPLGVEEVEDEVHPRDPTI